MTLADQVHRLLGLPVVDKDHYQSAWAQWSLLLRKHRGAPKLKVEQGEVLEHLHQGNPSGRGVFGNLGVGSGKTLTAMLAPRVAEAVNPLLMLPPGLEEEFGRQFDIWAEHYHVVRPTLLPYSQLSRPEHAEALDYLAPDLIICDEAHYLRHLTSARTKRFFRYIRDNPETRVVLMSGTMTGGSLAHFAHLLYCALRDESPGPLTLPQIQRWANVIDASGEALRDDERAFQPLIRWSGAFDLEEAYNARLAATPGVVLGRRMSCDASIHLRRVGAGKAGVPKAIAQAIARLKSDWELPDGTLLVEASQMVAAERQMSAGFWYKPGPVPSVEWDAARAAWASELRHLLNYRSRRGFDSPALIEAQVRDSTYADYQPARRALLEWDKHRHIKRPDSEPVWLDKAWLVDAALAWAKKHKQGIIWYTHRAVADALEEAGFDVRRGGDDPPDASVPLASLSMARFNKGFNLQHYHKMLYLEPPCSGTPWDQSLGRAHRQGQTEDTVYGDVLQRTWRQTEDFEKAWVNAQSMEAQMAQPHKLLLATREWTGGV